MTARTTTAFVLAAAASVAAQQTPVFRTSVDSVAVDVAVFHQGAAVAGLTAADFEVRDNGAVQTLDDVSHETLPVDLTLVVDTSGSMLEGYIRVQLRQALTEIGAHVRQGDQVQLVTFNQLVVQHSDALAAGNDFMKALGPTSGMSALFDALAVSLIRPSRPDRRQMAIVVTDGQDNVSVLGGPALLEVARRSDPAVFVILLTSGGPSVRTGVILGGSLRLVTGSAPAAGPAPNRDLFDQIAAATGGRVAVLQRDDDLGTSFVQAFDDFRTSYVLRYTLAGVPRPGWHELEVKVTRPGDFTIRARKGYFGA